MLFLICVAFTTSCITQTHSSIFDIKADEYIKKYLLGVYTAKSDLKGPTVTPITLPPKAYLKTAVTKIKEITKDPRNLEEFVSKRELELRKLDREVKYILNKNKTIPDFKKDEIEVQTRRFEELRELANGPHRREFYFDPADAKLLFKQKNKVVRLMEQFIYETRYKLPYVQVQQKKYRHTYRYQIGFCFAILQHLKLEQHVLYNTMQRYMKMFQALFIHIKMYEKIVRLDVDIKDVIVYIKKANWERMQIEQPAYFDQVKDIQQK